MMHEMRGMMDMMASGTVMEGMGDMDMSAMMQPMTDIMDEMMGMEMSDEMMPHMQQMRGMMDMMQTMMPAMASCHEMHHAKTGEK